MAVLAHPGICQSELQPGQQAVGGPGRGAGVEPSAVDLGEVKGRLDFQDNKPDQQPNLPGKEPSRVLPSLVCSGMRCPASLACFFLVTGRRAFLHNNAVVSDMVMQSNINCTSER
eukprot:scaffold413352_cov40-Prasinocladus_malaysianus.AAC.1